MATSNLAIAALVVGIIGLLGSWFPVLGAPLPIVAVILGFIALSSIKKEGLDGKGLAIAGIVLGFLGIAVQILVFVGFAALFSYILSNKICETGAPGLDCIMNSAQGQTVSFTLTNGLSSDITVDSFTGDGESNCAGSMTVSRPLAKGATGEFTFTTTSAFDDYAHCNLVMAYQKDGMPQTTEIVMGGKLG